MTNPRTHQSDNLLATIDKMGGWLVDALPFLLYFILYDRCGFKLILTINYKSWLTKLNSSENS